MESSGVISRLSPGCRKALRSQLNALERLYQDINHKKKGLE